MNGRLHGDQPEAGKDGMAPRLLYMIIIAVMLSLSQTVLTLITVVQFGIMLVNTGQRNRRLAAFGTDLGIWMAKAARGTARCPTTPPPSSRRKPPSRSR